MPVSIIAWGVTLARFGFPKGALLLLIALSVAVLLCELAGARELIMEDDFTGNDGDPPDPAVWEEIGIDAGDYNRIEANTLRTRQTNGWGGVQTHNFSTNRFTVLIDWKPRSTANRMFTLNVHTNVSGTMRSQCGVDYDHYWGWHIWYYLGGTKRNHVSFQNNAQLNVWFTFNVTFWDDKMNVTIRDRASGSLKWSKTDWRFDDLQGDNRIVMSISSDANWDNFKLYDLSRPPNEAPVWGPMAAMHAVEDVPLEVNFSRNVSDVDNDISELRITSVSTFVTGTSGLEVTFLFPNGVETASVLLVLSDGRKQVPKTVDFVVLPVNDPPDHSIPDQMTATEDIPLTLDLRPSVWDIDNDTGELFLIVDDPYASVQGLNLTVLFPDGVLGHDLAFLISDGLLTTEASIHFGVQPVDDPPVIDPDLEFEAIEDEVSTFNLTPHIHDVDTPIDELDVLVRDRNCTVSGRDLFFLITLGGINYTLELEVADAHTRVVGHLRVTVAEVNDPPVVGGVSPKLAIEDEPLTVDLSPYISDEDDGPEDLRLACDHAAAYDIDGLNLTLLYTTWVPEHTMRFRVTDSVAWSNGSFEVQVKAVNDPPEIIGIGPLPKPYIIVVDEGSEAWYDVLVQDEDNTVFEYSIDSRWDGVMVFSNGSLRVTAGAADVGTYYANVTVDDRNGGKDTVEVTMIVKNVNDPPTMPILVKPVNHTIVEEGTYITFSVDVSDPDMRYDQVLTVTWVSNVSGYIRALTTVHPLEFTTNELPIGEHRITVTATDGEIERSIWFDVQVVEKYVPPPPGPEKPSFLSEPTGIAAILLLVILVIVVVAIVVMRRGRPEEDATVATATVAPGSDTQVEVQEEAPSDLAALSQELDRMTTELEGRRQAERAMAPSVPAAPPGHPIAPPPPPPMATVPAGPPPAEERRELTPEEEADREHAMEVREVMKSLTQLPRGLPTALWGMDIAELGRAIVDGEKRTTADGAELVLINGKWYNADRNNLGRFMIEWKEEAAGPSGTGAAGDRASKLARLEERLLEGKISEETYERLRKKYESQ